MLEAFVHDVNGVAVFAMCVDVLYVDACFEFFEYFAAHDFEAFAGFVVFVGGFFAGYDSCVALEARFFDDVVQWCVALIEEVSYQGDGFGEVGEQFFVGSCRVNLCAVFTRLSASEGRECLAQVYEDAAVIYDQAVVFVFVHAVGAGNGLHQGVGFEWFVEIEC